MGTINVLFSQYNENLYVLSATASDLSMLEKWKPCALDPDIYFTWLILYCAALFYEDTRHQSLLIVEEYYIIVVSQVINMYHCGIVHKAVSDHGFKKNMLNLAIINAWIIHDVCVNWSDILNGKFCLEAYRYV